MTFASLLAAVAGAISLIIAALLIANCLLRARAAELADKNGGF